ncbi:MAG: TolC family protein [Parabacteroides sp.]|nr:TolC family protein [Parabacteroides sp.]
MATSTAADLRTRLMQAEEELRMATRRFTWTCYSKIEIIPADTSLFVWPVPLTSSLLSEVHQGYFHSLADEKAAIGVEKSYFFPELSVGCTRQKISPLKGLDSWMIGISFPLWFVPQKSRIKQAKIDYSIAQIEAAYQSRELANKVTELQAQLRQQGETLEYYITAALPEANALLQSVQNRFYESDTDINQFIQSLTTVLEIRKGYIEAVYNYNVTVLELELYTE